jgi:hypothetical protein
LFLSSVRRTVDSGQIFASPASEPEHWQTKRNPAAESIHHLNHERNAARGIGIKLIFRKKSDDQIPRRPVTREALQQSLTEAVRTSHPEFEDFGGVFIEQIAPAAPGGPNWAVRGVKYGRADRHRSGIILSYCVDEAQLEFEISD